MSSKGHWTKNTEQKIWEKIEKGTISKCVLILHECYPYEIY